MFSLAIIHLSGDLIIVGGSLVGDMPVVIQLIRILIVLERKGRCIMMGKGMLIFLLDPYILLSLPMAPVSAFESSVTTSSSNSVAETPTTAASTKREVIKKSDLYGECTNQYDSTQLDEKKVQDAMKKLSKQSKEDNSEVQGGNGGKKRVYNSMTTADVTLEEMEAYRRIKVQREDPMAKFLNSDELLEE